MQTSKLHIHAYNPDDLPHILKFTQEALGNRAATSKTEAFWHWKHHANPFGVSYGLCAITQRQQQIVGLRMLMRWSFQMPVGQSFQAVRAVDTATHAAYQRQGIFTTLTRQAVEALTTEGVHFIFNTPNRYSLPGYLKLGWQTISRWPIYIKPLTPLRMAGKRLRIGPRSATPDHFQAYFGPDIMPWATFVQRYTSEISEIVAYWERTRHRVGCRTVRDIAYLQWRYGQYPHLAYGVYPMESSGSLVGFAILRPNLRYGWQEVVLTDFVLAKSSLRQGQLLLKNLFKQVRGDYLVAHFSAATMEEKLLKSTGFLKVPGRGLTFVINPLNPPAQNLLNPTAWDLTLGDLEIF